MFLSRKVCLAATLDIHLCGYVSLLIETLCDISWNHFIGIPSFESTDEIAYKVSKLFYSFAVVSQRHTIIKSFVVKEFEHWEKPSVK